jgi:hypothetical protein
MYCGRSRTQMAVDMLVGESQVTHPHLCLRLGCLETITGLNVSGSSAPPNHDRPIPAADCVKRAGGRQPHQAHCSCLSGVQVTELHIVIAATSSNCCSFGECMGSDSRERRTAPPPLSEKPSKSHLAIILSMYTNFAAGC